MTRVGITGHQTLKDRDEWSWVSVTLREALDRVTPPLVGITSLAIGADQLFAELVLERGGTVHAVLPFRDIERSFAARDLPRYRALARRVTSEVLEVSGTDEDAYLAAGMRVVDLADIVVAVWNGLPPKGKGGTADVVAYARHRGVPLIQINPASRTVQRS